MSTIRNKTRKPTPPIRNKTRKSNVPSRNNAIKAMYNKDYYGTELLPMTDILNYINASLNEFVINKEIKQSEHKYEAEFDDFFVISDVLERKETKSRCDDCLVFGQKGMAFLPYRQCYLSESKR